MVYEGDGQWLPKSTYQKHQDTDALRRKQEENSRHPAPLFVFMDAKTKLQTIMDELDWLGSLPITSPLKPLVFREEQEGVGPGTLDDYAKANGIFFDVQSCLLFLFDDVKTMPPSDDGDSVAGQIQDALGELDTLKWRQWHCRGGTIQLADQRHPGNIITAIVVNTGEESICSC